MRRWTLVALALLGLHAVADAQSPPRTARIGVLLFSTPAADPNVRVFRDAMRELGWIEGRNLALEFRFADGQPDRLPDLAAELATLKPDIIYALGGDVAPWAKRATSTIPIVATVSNDPVAAGLVTSLSRPGANVTGLTFLLSDLAAKRVEILREIMPKLSAVGVLWNPDHRDPDFKETQAAGAKLGLRVASLEARRPAEIDAALQAGLRERIDALIVVSSRLMVRERARILDFAGSHRLPMATGWGDWAERGALLTYGPNIDEIVRRSAHYVDRILRGARPGELPMEQPTRFELVVNLKVAQAFGLIAPPSLLARADRVVQ
jgi:putative tryptophan/tyrosine transport system substrate-binding protein